VYVYKFHIEFPGNLNFAGKFRRLGTRLVV
jgi:hypothetical protein